VVRRDPERAAAWLSEVAAGLKQLANGEVLAEPDPVLSFLRALVDAANRSTARQGETLVSAER